MLTAGFATSIITMTVATTPDNDSQSPGLTDRLFNRISIQFERAFLKILNQHKFAFDLE